jgi:hypothetical protein
MLPGLCTCSEAVAEPLPFSIPPPFASAGVLPTISPILSLAGSTIELLILGSPSTGAAESLSCRELENSESTVSLWTLALMGGNARGDAVVSGIETATD